MQTFTIIYFFNQTSLFVKVQYIKAIDKDSAISQFKAQFTIARPVIYSIN